MKSNGKLKQNGCFLHILKTAFDLPTVSQAVAELMLSKFMTKS